MGKLYEAAVDEDRLAILIELRNLLADRLDNCGSDRDIAALSRQLVQVTAEIDELRKATEPKATSIAEMRKKVKVVK